LCAESKGCQLVAAVTVDVEEMTIVAATRKKNAVTVTMKAVMAAKQPATALVKLLSQSTQ